MRYPFTEKQISSLIDEERRKSPDIVVGLQWGDEGKGKITDTLSNEYQWIVRYQGGSNAGHTVYIDGKKFVTHSVPTGILNPNCKVVITHGCVVNIPEIIEEVAFRRKRNFFQGSILSIRECTSYYTRAFKTR